jgi:hypothetical protein
MDDAAGQGREEAVESVALNPVGHGAARKRYGVPCEHSSKPVLLVAELRCHGLQEDFARFIRGRRVHANLREDVKIVA